MRLSLTGNQWPNHKFITSRNLETLIQAKRSKKHTKTGKKFAKKGTDLVLKLAIEPIVLIRGGGEDWDVTLRDSLRRGRGELRGKVVVVQ